MLMSQRMYPQQNMFLIKILNIFVVLSFLVKTIFVNPLQFSFMTENPPLISLIQCQSKLLDVDEKVHNNLLDRREITYTCAHFTS